MKRKEFEQLCGELRLGKLLPGDNLDRLAKEAADGYLEHKQFIASLVEGYGRVCADRKVARELLRQVELRGRPSAGTHPLRGKASPTAGREREQ